MRFFAPAKINLFLDVLGRRVDGFHDLSTLFVALDWGDELTVMPRAGEAPAWRYDGPFAGDIGDPAGDLARRAVEMLHDLLAECPACEPEIPDVALHKHIPARAGLGGGSSDAAAALAAMNEHWHLGLETQDLERLALEIGSDCPFFIGGGAQAARGRGEVLEPVAVRREFALLVAVPHEGIATPEAFRLLRDEDKGSRTDVVAVRRWLAGEDDSLPPLHNAFQQRAAKAVPSIGTALEELRRLGAARALLSGSGSACFGLFDSRGEAERAAGAWHLPVRALRAASPYPRGACRLDST